MIEVKTNNGTTSVSMEGSLTTLITDTAMILQSIRRTIADESPMSGVAFSAMLTELINDPENSPLKASLSDNTGTCITIDAAELMRQMREE